MTSGDDVQANGMTQRDERAALYVLGLLDEAEAVAFERAVELEPDTAALVAAWRERLADLDADAPPLVAGDALWRDIEARLPGAARPRPTRARAGDSVWTRLWSSLPVWRAAGLMGAAAALMMAVALTRVLMQPPPDPVMIAVLIGEDGTTPGAVVEVQADGSVLLVPLSDIPVPSGRTLQVWTKWSEERGPVSVGLTGQARSMRLDTAGLPPPQPDQLYEITLEPEGGSPTGLPTGPILMLGRASQAL